MHSGAPRVPSQTATFSGLRPINNAWPPHTPLDPQETSSSSTRSRPACPARLIHVSNEGLRLQLPTPHAEQQWRAFVDALPAR